MLLLEACSSSSLIMPVSLSSYIIGEKCICLGVTRGDCQGPGLQTSKAVPSSFLQRVLTPPAAKVHVPPSAGEQVAASQHRQDSRRSKQAFTYFSLLKLCLTFDHVLLCPGLGNILLTRAKRCSAPLQRCWMHPLCRPQHLSPAQGHCNRQLGQNWEPRHRQEA